MSPQSEPCCPGRPQTMALSLDPPPIILSSLMCLIGVVQVRGQSSAAKIMMLPGQAICCLYLKIISHHDLILIVDAAALEFSAYVGQLYDTLTVLRTGIINC